ncbi:MAG: protein kinase [Planctomycetes bacterium]|nr:protein kinase [Planctomycetota bacterium]
MNDEPNHPEKNLINAARRQVHGPPGAETLSLWTEQMAADTAQPPPVPPSGSFAGYKIVRELHRGGQGVVYQAFQESTKRKVAIKVMKEGPFAGSADKARFDREVQVLGQLKHPNIVTIHDSGSAAGSFYFVMDYISGQPLDVYMAGGEHSIDDTLRLFAKICDAVNAAHLKGVIHRDLKPGNIRIDDNGEPYILDFGLAKVAASEQEASLMTMTGQFIGSLPWSSPEQAEGKPGQIDIRTDVYSLGVVLYQMLTGRFPYEVVGNMRDVLDNILKTEPARPSTIRKQINDEVETIVLKCLSKERERRYQTAGELGRDVRHYLAGEPIEAKRESGWYVLKKHLHRHRATAVFVSTIVLMLVVGLGVSLSLWRLALHQRNRAQEAEQRADTRRIEAEQARQDERFQRTRAEVNEKRARWQAYLANVRAAQAALSMSDTASVHRALRAAPSERRDWEWRYLHAESDKSLATFAGNAGSVSSVAFSPDGRWLASGSREGTISLWDTKTGAERSLGRVHSGWVCSVAFSPDGQRLASGSHDGAVRVSDVPSGRPVVGPLEHGSLISSVVFSPDGKQLATGCGTRTVRLWDAITGAELEALKGHESFVLSVAFSSDGTRLASGSDDGTIGLWDATAGELLGVIRGHTGVVRSVAFGPESTRLASGAEDGTVRVWEVTTGDELAVLRGHERPVAAVAFSPDGARLASSSDDGTVRLWDPTKVEEARAALAVLRGHERPVSSVAFNPDGTRLVSGSLDGTIRLWDPTVDERPIVLPEHEGLNWPTAFSSDCGRFASGTLDRSVRVWDATSGEVLAVMRGHDSFVCSVAFSPDDTRLASGAEDGTVGVWNATTGAKLKVLRGHDDIVWAVAFSPDGARLASGSRDGTIRLWDTTTGAQLNVLQELDGWFWSVAFSPDGKQLASGPHGKAVRIWDATTGAALNVLRSRNTGSPLAFSPDGRQLASGCGDSVSLWDTTTGAELSFLQGHHGRVWSVAFSPNGARLASAAEDGTVRVWDTTTGDELAVLRGLGGNEMARSVAFSSDACRLACASGNGKTVRIWDTIPCRERHGQRKPKPATVADGQPPSRVPSPADTAKILREAAGQGRLAWRLTEPEEFEGLLGAPTARETEDDGMQVLKLHYPETVALFGRIQDADAPFTLRTLWHRGQTIDIGEDGPIVLRNERDLAKFDRFWGFAGASLVKLDLRSHGELLDAMPFDSRTIWPPTERLPRAFAPVRRLEEGKNPGLGLRDLHAEGIDGRGVRLAIIDQPLLNDHQEYADQIAHYEALGVAGMPPQMHGPPVASIAVGRSCGVAPAAQLSYFAVPTWKSDSQPFCDILAGIMAQNEGLAAGERIRVVSISAGMFSNWANFERWQRTRALAEQQSILIITCDEAAFPYGTLNRVPGRDPNDPESYRAGRYGVQPGALLVPTGHRTTASHCGPDVYTYWTESGMSWATPYLAGLAALAYQVDPDLQPETIREQWRRTAAQTSAGMVVNPRGFIAAVRHARQARIHPFTEMRP